MKRKYLTTDGNTIETTHADFFVGTEIERTIAYGMNTLFVVGVQPVNDIFDLTARYNIDHVYFGANQSFHTVSSKQITVWDDMIKHLLKIGTYSTLDFTFDQWPDVMSMSCYRLERFIPMVSVMPINNLNWRLHNPATVLKFDNQMGVGSGVWCAGLDNMIINNRNLTKWDEYKEDTIVSPNSKIVELAHPVTEKVPSPYDDIPSDVEPTT